MRCQRYVAVRLLLPMACLALPLRSQDSLALHAKVSPGWFTGGGEKSIGARWDARWVGASKRLGHVALSPGGSCVPVRPADEFAFDVETSGALALKQRANADPIRVSARGEFWRSFFNPGCPNANPDLPSTGSYYRGSGSVSAFLRGEGIQGSGEVDVSTGLELLYTHSRRDGWWIAMPSLQLVAGTAHPVQSAIRDSLAAGKEWLSREELHATWHLPLPALFRVDVNVRGWRTQGLADTLKSAGLDEGSFLAVDLTRTLRWRVGRVSIREIFVRRVEGQVPQEWKQQRSWMVGVASGA